MLFALWLACAGPESAEDLDELLDRIEALEAQVVALQLASGTAEVDDDGDGLRDRDGLPLGTKRGDVLFDIACEGEGIPVTFPTWFKDMPLVPPRWEVWANEAADGSADWRRQDGWLAGGSGDFCTGGDRRWVAIAW